MAQPVWETPAGSLGVVPESIFYQQYLTAYDPDGGEVYYSVIAGSLPEGIQCAANGAITGVPLAIASLQGVPVAVSKDITSKFTIRAYTESLPRRIKDRTFTLTITGNDVPEFTTPAGNLGSFYDGDQLNIQIGFTNTDPNEGVIVRLAAGELPGGITVTPEGLITGYIEPAANVEETPGYDVTPIYTLPYDFIVSAISKNYQFTLEVTDGKTSNLRTFEFFVYDRTTLTADTTEITADTTDVTADETTERRPFLINASPSDLGTVRGDNYFAYQFIGNDYDTPALTYAIAVNEGSGLPPGISLDPNSGWYYGYIPDQGITEVQYSFNVTVYQSEYAGTPITCTTTTFGTNRITCTSTEQIATGQPIVFTGTGFGGITASPTLVYYVLSVLNSTQFTVTTNLSSTTAATLTTASGTMQANLVIASDPYPFLLTISGAVDAEVTWLTASDLGNIDNGDTSLLKIEAVNRGGRELKYRLKSGAFNELPQGLELLPSGEISGRVSFNTFAIDLGETTIDNNQTTWDSSFTFTVNAYAEDTAQVVYDVASVTVLDGGSGYSDINTPVLAFNAPVGASAVQATAGAVTVVGGKVTSVAVANTGAGYSSQATLTVIEGFGGSGAVFQPVMRATGIRDVVSVYKTFTVHLKRAFNAPYQNLLVQAMPPDNDRVLIASLLDNENIFIPEYIFRPTDPFFGKATRVVYQHAFGLAPDTQDRYVSSLYENHYWKNLVLGSIQTAQAVDPVTGEVVYEVVYSKIIDDLVNADGDSVAKIVNLAYPIVDELDGSSQITQVYPNSLVDMRNQVIDVVGQISTKLPLWMTSKQANGRILGFTPAWVLAYTNPGRSNQIAYYIQTQFGDQLNMVDFKVDRYILDRELSKNWDTVTQHWTPTPNLTTFDRFNTSGYNFLGQVNIATDLAFSDVNNRTMEYINNLGGLDGIISAVDGNTIVFPKQQDYNGPPGSYYANPDDAWQDYLYPYDSGTVTGGPGTFDHDEFDEAFTIPSGELLTCTDTSALTNRITTSSTANMIPGQEVVFTANAIGGLELDVTYYVLDIYNATQFRITATAGSTTPVTLTTSTGGTMLAQTADQRMAIYTISEDFETGLISLTLTTQTNINDYVQVVRGNFYRSAQLYYPPTPGEGLTEISWIPLPTVVTTETIFDEASVAFEEPVDMYDPTDTYDKYLVFPKANILV